MATAAQATPSQGQKASPQQINAVQRKLVVNQSVKMKQSIASGTVTPSSTPVINIVPRNVGLVLDFIVEFNATFSTIGSGTVTATQFGALNVFSNIQFTDLQNNQRHNTYGFHFALTKSAKDRQPFLAANTLAQTQGDFGANWSLTSVTAPTTEDTGSAKGVLEIPIAYDHEDLRGSIYANVVANQMQLQLTINPNPCPASGDDTFAVFYGEVSTISSLTYNIYQEYYDQIPTGAAGVVLPQMDISTVYQLLYSNFTSIAQNQDNYYQYTNFRRFMGVWMIYNSTGSQGGRNTGSDIDYLAQVSANFTNIFKVDPFEQARICRRILNDDPPPGSYYFSTRQKPIYTLTYGNMQIDLNPSTAEANAYALFMWEFFALQNTLSSAGSLPANG